MSSFLDWDVLEAKKSLPYFDSDLFIFTVVAVGCAKYLPVLDLTSRVISNTQPIPEQGAKLMFLIRFKPQSSSPVSAGDLTPSPSSSTPAPA